MALVVAAPPHAFEDLETSVSRHSDGDSSVLTPLADIVRARVSASPACVTDDNRARSGYF